MKGPNLNIKVHMDDDLGNPVGGAIFDGTLSGAGRTADLVAPTKKNGEETFILRSALPGCYTIVVNGVMHDVLTWDTIQPDNLPFCF